MHCEQTCMYLAHVLSVDDVRVAYSTVDICGWRMDSRSTCHERAQSADAPGIQ